MSTSGGGCGSLDKATKAYMFEYQVPATLNQAAPVQNTWYTLLDTTVNVRVYGVTMGIEDTNETLNCQVTIDGQVWPVQDITATHSQDYYGRPRARALTRDIIMAFEAWNDSRHGMGFLVDGHSVKIEIRKTTAAGVGNLVGIVTYGVLKSI